MRSFDFHIHTRASDGFRAAADILPLAGESGIEGLSITDHDTVDGYDALGGAGAASGNGFPWVLPGIELSTRLGTGEAHILGYFPDGITPAFASFVEGVIEARRQRMADGIVKLREKGIDISFAECSRLAAGRVLNRSHIAQVLVDKRYIARPHGAYPGLLGPQVIARPDLDAADAAREIARRGGISVWAHPSAAGVEEHGPRLKEAGLAGVEVIIPRRNAGERRGLARRSRELGFLVTGGSDWHGRPSDPPLGKFRVPEEAVSEFLRAIGR